MDKEKQDRIDAYLRNEMTMEERAAFDREVELDPDLKEQLDLTRHIQRTLGSHQKKLDAMCRWDKEMEAEKRRNGRRWTGMVRRWTYIAASLAACAFLGYWALYPSQPTGEDFDERWFVSETIYRGMGDFQLIDSLMATCDYEEALSVIDSLECVCRAELNDTVGLVLSEEDRYNCLLAEDQIYQLHWQRIRVLWANGEIGKMRSLLREYQQQPGVNQMKARSLWDKLDGTVD